MPTVMLFLIHSYPRYVPWLLCFGHLSYCPSSIDGSRAVNTVLLPPSTASLLRSGLPLFQVVVGPEFAIACICRRFGDFAAERAVPSWRCSHGRPDVFFWVLRECRWAQTLVTGWGAKISSRLLARVSNTGSRSTREPGSSPTDSSFTTPARDHPRLRALLYGCDASSAPRGFLNSRA